MTWVTQLPYNVDPTYLKYRKYEIDTTIEELPDLSVPAPIPWWVYFLAALAGVLLLLLIVYIFYKVSSEREIKKIIITSPSLGDPALNEEKNFNRNDDIAINMVESSSYAIA